MLAVYARVDHPFRTERLRWALLIFGALAFMDAYNGALIAKNDHFVYGMAGITLKF